MVNYKYKDLFEKSHVDKQLKIATDDGMFVATNEDINWENFELTESLCSDSELRFGSCEASMVKFQIRNAFIPLAGKWITITETLDGNTDVPLQYGRYKVFSDKPTADKEYRDIIAYDAMNDVINSSAISWYNTILPNKNSKITMKQFRTSFLNHFNLEQKEITLVNDDMIVEKTIQVGEGTEIDNEMEQVSILKESSLSGLDIITAICEINGCFGHIGRDGKFHWIYLQQDIMGLYPSNTLFPDHAPEYLPQSETGHLYPQNPKSERIGNGTYISADYEDFVCKNINKIQIREKENDIGAQWPEEKVENENAYIIQDNFLVYGKSKNELSVIAKNIFERIKSVVYRPFSSECVGNPCLEVGDPIRLLTKYELIESYILKRTLKGIQDLRDSYSALGQEEYSEKVNSISQSIIQLKGKTNILERNVDETRLEMRDMGEELSTEISVTAAGINETIKNTKEGLETKISKTVRSIEMSVSNNKTGKTAEVKLLITDEGGTRYEVTADKIDLTGLVSFTNLETGGQTIINGNNITTGKINCDLLNGGKILGQTIEGGRINGAIIKAKDGIYLQYINPFERPPVGHEFVFAEVETTSGAINDIAININNPFGRTCISLGHGGIPAHDIISYPVSFPNGAMINGAIISEALIQSAKKTILSLEVLSDEIGDSSNATIKVRTSGVFNTIYGEYHTKNHAAGNSKILPIKNLGTTDGNKPSFFPKYQEVKGVSYHGECAFVFKFDTEGNLSVRNASTINLISETEVKIKYRIDYFNL